MDKKIIQIPGWLTMDSNGAVYFHDGEPYSVQNTTKRVYLDGVEERSTYQQIWYSKGIKMYNLYYKDQLPALPAELTDDTPIRVTLQIVQLCEPNS